jgi:hypothetical protein
MIVVQQRNEEENVDIECVVQVAVDTSSLIRKEIRTGSFFFVILFSKKKLNTCG